MRFFLSNATGYDSKICWKADKKKFFLPYFQRLFPSSWQETQEFHIFLKPYSPTRALGALCGKLLFTNPATSTQNVAKNLLKVAKS